MSCANTNFEMETKLDGDVLLTPTGDVMEACNSPSGKEREAHCAHMITRDGVRYAGAHLIVDMWGGQHLDNLEYIEVMLKKCVAACGATLLHVQLHNFSENNGVTGVAVLAESHIALHTWPEFDYAAFDIFMCGTCEPRNAVDVLRESLMPKRTEVSEHLRGRIGPNK